MKQNKRFTWIEAVSAVAVVVGAVVFALVFRDDSKVFIYGLTIFLAAFIAMKAVSTVFMCKKTTAAINMEDLVGRISDSISGCRVSFKLDDGLTIIATSKKFLSFTGYTRDEIAERFDNKFINLIEQNYRGKVLNALKNQSIEESKSQVFYRLLCADEPKEVVNMFAFISQGKAAQNFLIDLSSIRYLQEEKDIAAERYRIAAEQSESIIFDFNNIDKTVYINSYFKDKFGYEVQGNLLKNIEQHKLIHEDDIGKFMQLAHSDKDYHEIELRLKKMSGEYIWCKMRITTQRNEEKRAVRFIGKIIDVDQSRKEKQQLIEKARRDEMTGMFNKLCTERLISEALSKDADTSLSAFLLFDIDNFKQINDRFGHMQGDSVLYQIGGDLRLIFRSTDILGRIGGDEFVVFIKNISSEEHAAKKALDILQLIESKYTKEKDGFVVSVSVGISFFDKDGDTYKELFMKADKALYEAKRKGKNTFEIYQPD